MSSQHRLRKNDGADIAFALSCYYAGAITFAEFQEWLFLVIAQDDDPSPYVFDMIDVKTREDFKPFLLMGFVPGDTLSVAQHRALTGIAIERGLTEGADGMSPEAAGAALDAEAAFRARFCAFFPFIVMG